MAGRKRIVVAMSGGVDSSTAAALLHEQGHEVIGIGLRLPEPPAAEESPWGCCGVQGMHDARRAASRIGIPFHVLNYKEIFERAVIAPFCRSYLDGRTPNPCVECNRAVKFGRLLKLADALEADHLATGHYARTGRAAQTGRHVLKKGVDAGKDQSYFLHALSQEQLSRALFPLGGMTKQETRELARSFGLRVCDKPASQDVCFLGTGDYRRYLAERFPESVRPGPIVDPAGRVIGEHGGIAFYTVGQRKRLGAHGRLPLYVLSMDARTATIVVGGRDEMMTRSLSVRQVNWIAFEQPPGPLELKVRVRYREAEVPAEVLPGEEGGAEVRFAEPHAPAAAGQSAVFYDGDVVVGGGIIE